MTDQDKPHPYAKERLTGELLLRVASEMEDMTGMAAEPEGLTGREARALQYVVETLPQHKLSLRLGVDPARVTAIIHKLEDRGLVSRKAWVDRRVRMVSVTDDGLTVTARIGQRLIAMSPLVNALSAEERDTLHDILSKVHENLPSLD